MLTFPDSPTFAEYAARVDAHRAEQGYPRFSREYLRGEYASTYGCDYGTRADTIAQHRAIAAQHTA